MKIEPLRQSNAEEIANNWHYEGIYSFYDMQADPEDYEEILSPEARGNHYYFYKPFCSLLKKISQ